MTPNSNRQVLHGTIAADPDQQPDLTQAVEALLPALERFLSFDAPNETGPRRPAWSAALREPLPIAGDGPQAVLDLLRDVVIPNGTRTGAPGFAGWIGSMPTVVSSAAALAATVAGSTRLYTHAFNLLEAVALRWLADLLGIPSSFQGVFVSGGSVGNLVGLGAARQHAAERLGIDPARDGLGALPRPRIYGSSQVHHTVHRAAGVLGLGRRAVVEIPTDDCLRIDVPSLRERIRRDRDEGATPVAVVGIAGTTNTGAIDPLPELVALCRDEDLWLHVDGAYGLFGVLDPAVRHLYGDLGEAHSLVVDPHKWLAAPVGCSAVYVRDAALLGRAFTEEPADYLEEIDGGMGDGPMVSEFASFGYGYHHLGVEHSAPSRGVLVWSILKEFGANGVAERIRRDNGFAWHVARRAASEPELELLAPVTLSICCFRYVPRALRGHDDPQTRGLLDHLNRAILRRVWAGGRSVPSSTIVRGAFAIRPCFINSRTTLADVDALVNDVLECGAAEWKAWGEER